MILAFEILVGLLIDYIFSHLFQSFISYLLSKHLKMVYVKGYIFEIPAIAYQ